MCRVLEVSRSGFYDWQSRPRCERELTDELLGREIEAIFEASGQTYGSPRVHRWLRRNGFATARKRVARIHARPGPGGPARAAPGEDDRAGQGGQAVGGPGQPGLQPGGPRCDLG